MAVILTFLKNRKPQLPQADKHVGSPEDTYCLLIYCKLIFALHYGNSNNGVVIVGFVMFICYFCLNYSRKLVASFHHTE